VTFAPVLKGLVLADAESLEFHSRFTGHDYHIYVSLPASYRQGDRRYPVLYVPDADELFLGTRAANSIMGLGNMLKNLLWWVFHSSRQVLKTGFVGGLVR
jgi:hypothetical protein